MTRPSMMDIPGMQDEMRRPMMLIVSANKKVDYVANNPATDKHIVKHFDAEHPEGKAENKRALQERLGLELSSLLITDGLSSTFHEGRRILHWSVHHREGWYP